MWWEAEILYCDLPWRDVEKTWFGLLALDSASWTWMTWGLRTWTQTTQPCFALVQFQQCDSQPSLWCLPFSPHRGNCVCQSWYCPWPQVIWFMMEHHPNREKSGLESLLDNIAYLCLLYIVDTLPSIHETMKIASYKEETLPSILATM